VSDRVYSLGNFQNDNGAATTPDLALVHVPEGFVVNGSRSGFRTSIRASGPADADTVAMCGAGGNAYAPGGGVNGAGTLRCGALGVLHGQDIFGNPILNYHQLPGLGVMYAPGDSGGPAFFEGALVGINSGISFQCAGMPSQSCTKGQLTTLTGGFAISVPDFAQWIEAVMLTDWNPAARVQWIDTRLAEIVGTKVPWSNVGSTPWARANRSAQEVCVRRGYVGGLYTGEALDDKRGVICLGSQVAQFFDVQQSEIEALDEPFEDMETVPWSQAQRMADKLCIARGLPHGFFTGNHVDLIFTGWVIGLARGLVCQDRSLHWRDVDVATLSASSDQPVWSVDWLDWGTASRAAGRYCWNRGYTWGYFTGWQSIALGTVCLATVPPRIDADPAVGPDSTGRSQVDLVGVFEGSADLTPVVTCSISGTVSARIDWSGPSYAHVSFPSPTVPQACTFALRRGDGEASNVTAPVLLGGSVYVDPTVPPNFCSVTGTC
jgi:hypothetical protein